MSPGGRSGPLQDLLRPGQEALLPEPGSVDHAVTFAGHMVDLPDRDEPRFPPELEPRAREAVEDALAALLADLPGAAIGLSAAARGGDLLFVEACGRLGLPHILCLPLPPESFVDTSVGGAGEEWVRRFRDAVEAARAGPDRRGPLVMPEDFSRPSPEAGPYQRFNVWLLELARRLADDVHLLALWDGSGGDGPGGTEDMVRTVIRGGGRVIHVDSSELLRKMEEGAGR